MSLTQEQSEALNTFNESEDELAADGGEWEWIYGEESESTAQDASAYGRKLTAPGSYVEGAKDIIGARKGSFEIRKGDAVMLKAERNEQWVALLYDFVEEEVEDEKEAKFMWFTSPRDIRNKAKRRSDAFSNEIYITGEFDENPLYTILCAANVVSPQTLKAKYPNGKIPRKSEDNGKTFVCRMGCNSRTATYTEEFIWEEVYRGASDLEPLRERVERGTKATRLRGGDAKPKTRDLEDFIVEDSDGDENGPKTPRKRRKLDVATTPKSLIKSVTPRKFTTPTHKRIVTKRPLEFTPLGTRILSPNHTMSSPFQVARSHLHVSAVPTALPCREEEFSQVYSCLESAIIDGMGSCIYIAGTPGTGKTATVREVVAQLNASVEAEELDDFIFVEINGMKVTDPHQSYSLLWEALQGERLSPAHALNLLEREFSTPSPRRVPCVVLMDELDQLVTKNQSVMYNFFNWPNLRHSRLIVLAVANTMDLPERTLSNKITSRLGLTRITFPGYNHEQLIKIIQSRLEGVTGNIVDPDAIQFASRKVAQVSGDARRALDICRRAVEIAETEAEASNPQLDVAPDTPSKKAKDREKQHKEAADGTADTTAVTHGKGRVTIAVVQRAIREATTTPMQQYLRCLPLSCKVFLAAVLARVRRTGVGDCVLGDVVEEAKRLGTMSQLLPVRDFLLANSDSGGTKESSTRVDGLKSSRVLAMGAAAMDLVEGGVVLVESRRGERTAKVRLNVGEEEIRLALKDDAEVRGLGFSG